MEKEGANRFVICQSLSFYKSLLKSLRAGSASEAASMEALSTLGYSDAETVPEDL